MSVDFTPGLSPYKETGTFRFWCQKVLPLVYDDSLSYYELLCKVVNYLNDVISNVDGIRTDTEALRTAYIQLQDYVNNYFDNLDVQEEINKKLDEMATDGSLSALLSPFIPDVVADWLEDHLSPTTPPIDDTLTIRGAAADAEATGDKITDLYVAINEYPNEILHITPFISNSYVKRNGEISAYADWSRTGYIDIGYCSKLIAKTSNSGDYNCFYNANKEFISYFAVGTTDTEVSVPTNAKYVMFSNINQGMADLTVTFISKEQESNVNNFAEINTEIDELKEVTGMFSKTIDQLDDASNGLSRLSRWVIGFYKKGTVVGDLRLVIVANSLSVVKAQIWSTDNGTTYYPVKTIDPISCRARTVDQFYDLYFPPFTLEKDSFLTFTDSSSGNYGRYATAEGKNLLYFAGNLESITVADMSTLRDAELSYYITTYSDTSNIVTVKSDGSGTYRTVIDAVENEAEGTPIFIYPGTYKGTVQAFEKRIILIGVDRNACILQSTSGLYANPAINASCGYIENLTIRSDYINGESNEIESDQSGAYAIHCENEYGVGKTLEIHHCTLYSDFFPALGCGLRKDFHLILDDCELINNQISGRGNYTEDGSLGALYFHDTIGEKGAQRITVKNCILRSSLGNTMTIYRVYPASASDHVTCNFIENVLKDAVNGYSNNIWERDSNPFGTGAFSIDIGFGNSNSYLNNN